MGNKGDMRHEKENKVPKTEAIYTFRKGRRERTKCYPQQERTTERSELERQKRHSLVRRNGEDS